VPIDRAATLRQAEKLLRQGKVDQAIAEYVRLVEDQPRDWNTANVLGDLYVRAGHLDRAIEQFSRIAESLIEQGFLPRASAVYKKILKLKPDADHALVQAGELAAQQGLLADARACFAGAAQVRRARGDTKGALEIVRRVGALDPSDIDARLSAARARHELDDLPGALQEFNDLAAMLIGEGREVDALVPLSEVAGLDPGNAHVRRELARILVAQGRNADAAKYLTTDAVGADAGLLVVAADLRFRQGELSAGMEMVEALLALDDVPAAQITELGLSLAEQQPDTSYAILARLVDAKAAAGEWTDAADLLTRFIALTRHHIVALTRLVDVCVDGELQDRTVDAQALLADAYLETGAAAEAKYVAEDLLTRQPWERRHFARLRSALALGGAPDPDQALADWLADTQLFGIDNDPFAEAQTAPESVEPQPPDSDSTRPEQDVSTATAVVPSVAPPSDPPADEREMVPPPPAANLQTPQPADVPAAPARPAGDPRNPHSIDLELIFGRPGTPAPPAPQPPRVPQTPTAPLTSVEEEPSVEEDLSVALDEFNAARPVVPSAKEAAAAPADIESVFAKFRDDAEHRPADDPADVAYTRGVALVEAGDLESSIEPLRTAARSPRRRFAAASLLARVYQQKNSTAEAIEWLGHAVDAPATSAQERFETLFRLAELLEISGERDSALAVFLELQADAGEYRDIANRIARLSRTQGGG